MQGSLAASPGLWIALAALAGAALGFLLGRIGGAAGRRARALQLALAEERAAHDRARSEYEDYRKRVADHFTETSERLHDLTLQYRSVYEHLAKGATELCPEGFSKLEGGLGLDALPEEAPRPPAAGPEPASEPDPAQAH
jgi:uncharacterized membrane-anchored protein YhcB (DUF1043 family)